MMIWLADVRRNAVQRQALLQNGGRTARGSEARPRHSVAGPLALQKTA